MKKKYYFNSKGGNVLNILGVLSFLPFCIVLFFVDKINLILIISFLTIEMFFIIYTVLCFLSFIEIDYEKKELYIKHWQLNKKLKFDDVSIEIYPLSRVDFTFQVITYKFTRRITYRKYENRIKTYKRINEVNELIKDLKNISNGNY